MKNIEKIRVTRVDLPFTYTMHESKEFSDYSNVYRILGLVFIKRYPKVRPKAIIDLISNKKETITYTDTRISSAYNKKIMIYNQYINLKDKLDEGEFDRTIKEFPDLENRMRIEVSRRIVIRDMELDIFRAYSLFDRYLNEFKKDLRKTIFNLELLDEVYKEESEVLASKLEEYKESKGSAFTYETFILKEIDNIYDYKILREGIGLITPNEKTRENAITIIRKILRGVEEENGKIILDVRKIIKDIHETIEDSFYNKRNSRKERIDVF